MVKSSTTGLLCNKKTFVKNSIGTERCLQMMKAFWDNIGEAHAMSVQLKDTLTLKNATVALAGDPHPGAVKYWKERGVEIVKPLKYTVADVKKFKAKMAAKKKKK